MEILENSRILNIKYLKFLRECFNSNNIELKLLFKSTSRSTCRSFHQACENYSNLLILIQSNYLKKFGGFTKSPLKPNRLEMKVVGDGSDFLFSLTHERKLVNTDRSCAIFRSNKYLVRFGEWDLWLGKNCFKFNTDAGSSSLNYYGQNDILDEERNSYLAGNKRFKVINLEAYQVLFS